jgi:hypothetical protein
MARWLRLYESVLDDPKVQKLPDSAFRAWVNLLCLAARTDGLINVDVSNIAFSLRKSEQKTREILQILQSGGLLIRSENGWKPHNWDKWQYKSDVSTERVRAFRKRHETVSVTPPDTEQNRAEESNTPRVLDAPKRKSKHSLPDIFPLQADKDWAIAFWLKRGRVDLCNGLEDEVSKFRDHHAAKLTNSADWSASWRTWTQNAVKFSNGGHNGRPARKSNHETFYDAASAVAARILGEDREINPSGPSPIILLPTRANKAAD